MSKSNTTVTSNGLNPSAATSAKGGKSKDATKASAKDLTTLVVDFRQDKSTPAKAVNAFSKKVADLLNSNALSSEEKLAAVKAWQAEAIAQATAAIDRHAMRATKMSVIKRGTTGKGGIHQQDVVTELFGSGSKATAKDNNTSALNRAGLSV
jgi:hypothetical protein